ncbi:RmlD-like substrate binding domain-containing protein [Cunninghamella echinulata]|nr:RmlD-like substrate binding domain-containing protein [Cunninghamella echinulata]
MKVLITGASGLLGRAVYRNFKAANITVIGTAYSRATDKLHKLDLSKEEDVEKFLLEHKPDVIVHCAAERRPDVAEKDREGTLKLNAQTPGHLANFSKNNNIVLIYISTDYVFDGNHPPYDENSTPNPINFYGESKFAGEQAIKKVNDDAIILRVPILYGQVEYNGESAVNILIDVVKNNAKKAEMDNVCIRYPTNVDDIGRVIKDLAVKKIENGSSINGVYHFTAEEKFTKFDMCKIFADILKVPIDHLQPQNSISPNAAASRPLNSHLSIKRLQDLHIDTSTTSFQQWFQTNLAQ